MVTSIAAQTEQSVQWSRTEKIGFRLAFSISVLSVTRLAIFVPVHLFAPVKRPITLVINHCDVLDWQTTTTVGAVLLSRVTRAGSWQDQILRFKANHDASVLADILGLLFLALVTTFAWTLLDRRGSDYSRLNRYMRVYLRYGLATAMLSYAFIKVIPTQFGYLTPGELMQPFGQLSRFRVIWDFMAASPGYTIFAGLIELVGATLLFFRRTTLLGGLVLAGTLIEVIAMDLAFDVGAVTYANAFLLLDLIIIVPYLRPLYKILVLRDKDELPSEPLPTKLRWWQSPIAKTALVSLLSLQLIHINIQRRRSFNGSGRTVYGLFAVTTFARNGHPVTTSATDSGTWRRVASDPHGDSDGFCVQFADGDLRRFTLTDDTVDRVWTIHDDKDLGRTGSFHYAVHLNGDVSLQGQFAGDSLNMILHPMDPAKYFQLLGST